MERQSTKKLRPRKRIGKIFSTTTKGSLVSFLAFMKGALCNHIGKEFLEKYNAVLSKSPAKLVGPVSKLPLQFFPRLFFRYYSFFHASFVGLLQPKCRPSLLKLLFHCCCCCQLMLAVASFSWFWVVPCNFFLSC